MKISRKEASFSQLTSAINHFQEEDFCCSITLAAAAEGILPETESPYIFKELQGIDGLEPNLIINLLKHGTDYDYIEVDKAESVLIIVRAISKFIAVHHQSCSAFEGFLRDAHEKHGFPVNLRKEQS